MNDVSDEEVRARAVDDHHAALIGQLGTRSFVVVPLVARDTRLGALSLASASPGCFGPADLELAVEIGRRAALAIDNARLLRETQKAVQLRDDFLSVASHELRTPITSLMLTVGRLRRTGSRGKPLSMEALDASLDRVEHSTDRLRRLTDELLDVTRIEQGRLDFQPTTVELGALARRVVDDLKPDLAAANCPTRIETGEQVTGRWDASRLEQVMTNLLTNALKFGAGGPIEIQIRSTGEAGEVGELSVRDYGVGIERDRQPFVFDRFEQAVSSTSYGGLGLGLYIARRIVQAHRGEISVESEPGQGATFTVRLPRWA
jgi:signal transduction histidine kinase